MTHEEAILAGLRRLKRVKLAFWLLFFGWVPFCLLVGALVGDSLFWFTPIAIGYMLTWLRLGFLDAGAQCPNCYAPFYSRPLKGFSMARLTNSFSSKCLNCGIRLNQRSHFPDPLSLVRAEPFPPLKHLHLDGLLAAGVDPTSTYLIAVTPSGRSLYHIIGWERVASDATPVNPEDGCVPGIGPLAGIAIPVAPIDPQSGVLEFLASDGTRFHYQSGILTRTPKSVPTDRQ